MLSHTLPTLLMVTVVSAWPQDGLRGHWTGGEQIPGRPLVTVEIDLDRVADGWIGSLSIPEQSVSGIPLDSITYANGECSFRVKGMPNDPTYIGTLSADGKTIEGDYTEGAAKYRFKFARAGEPKVEVAKVSPRVAQKFVGDWEGMLKRDKEYRTVLRISNDDTGSRAILISVDDGGAQIPATSLEQRDSTLIVVLKPLANGRYVAEISRDGSELNGTLTMADGEIALHLRKVPARAHND